MKVLASIHTPGCASSSTPFACAKRHAVDELWAKTRTAAAAAGRAACIAAAMPPAPGAAGGEEARISERAVSMRGVLSTASASSPPARP